MKLQAKTISMGVLLIFVLLVLPLIQMHAVHADVLNLKSKSLYHSKTQFENQEGKKVSLSDLKGMPVVVAMLYTSCQMSCPLTMADLKAIEKGLSPNEKKNVKFAIFSFDSENDTSEKLKSFSQKQNVDLSRWAFFHASAKSIRELAALLGIKFKKLDSGDFDHSNIITILDQEGVIAHQQVGIRQNPDASIQMLKKLLGIGNQEKK